MRWDSVASIAIGYGLDDREVGAGVPVGSRIFPMSSRPALGPTQPPIQWEPGVKLTTHLQLVPRSRKCGSVHQLPHMTLWRV
jgi:hypothetical protein